MYVHVGFAGQGWLGESQLFIIVFLWLFAGRGLMRLALPFLDELQKKQVRVRVLTDFLFLSNVWVTFWGIRLLSSLRFRFKRIQSSKLDIYVASAASCHYIQNIEGFFLLGVIVGFWCENGPFSLFSVEDRYF